MSLQSAQALKNPVTDSGWQHYLPSKHTLQKGLLGLSTAAAIFSLFPVFRLPGALTARSVAALSSSADCAASYRSGEQKGVFARNCAKVGTIALGTFGLAVASTFLIAASLTADIALQALDGYRAMPRNEGKAFTRLTFMVIDALALGAVVAGSWPFMVAAASVNTVAMFAFTLYYAFGETHDDAPFETFCYFTLIFTSLASLGASLKLTKTIKKNSTFSITNTSGDKQTIYDAKNRALGTVDPGETLTLEVPYKQTAQHVGFVGLPGGDGHSVSIVPRHYGSYLKGIAFNAANDMTITNYDAISISTEQIVTKHPLAAEHFPTLPIGGNVLMESDE